MCPLWLGVVRFGYSDKRRGGALSGCSLTSPSPTRGGASGRLLCCPSCCLPASHFVHGLYTFRKLYNYLPRLLGYLFVFVRFYVCLVRRFKTFILYCVFYATLYKALNTLRGG